ncbi:MAG: hypothetical protein DMF61_01775 [Blastocatellia bacterium AA13]|nr:MAG: hypothetical protein DMF61_01775 [Blastocatellia bacterium AA13]
MKKHGLAALFLIAAAALGGAGATISAYQHREQAGHRDRTAHEEVSQDSQNLPEKDEINQTFQLAPGAKVEVSGINGPVDIQTSNTGTAEVNIVRSARTKDDLEYRKITVDQSNGGLVVRGEKEKDRNYRQVEVRERVSLKIPRQVELTTRGVNGRVTVGEIDGSVTMSGINGKVEVAQAGGYAHISGVNGTVGVRISRLGENGINVSGVNGKVELRFAEDLNADLTVTGINGPIHTDVSNLTVQGKMNPSNLRAKIGSGGSPISISGVNGSVTVSR